MTTCCRRRTRRTVVLGAVLLVASASSALAQSSMEIAIRDNRYEPAKIEIRSGTTVEWTNMGLNPHTVTSQPGSPASFESGTLGAQAGTFSFTFQTPGTYHYYCRFHGTADSAPPSCGMCGTVVVTAAASQPAGPTPVRTPTPRPLPTLSPRPTGTPRPTPTEQVLAPAEQPLATPELATSGPTPDAERVALGSQTEQDGRGNRALVPIAIAAALGGVLALAWHRRRMLR